MNTCTIDGCDNPVKRSNLCYGHYMKQWRYGTPTPQHPARHANLLGQRFGTLTVTARERGGWITTCDCGGQRYVRTGDLNRSGDSSICGIPGRHLDPHPTYATAHQRVRDLHGAPSTHQCIDCGHTASHWSYNHDDPDELYVEGLSAHPLAYSNKPSSYSPRCVPCHKRFDLDYINSTYSRTA